MNNNQLSLYLTGALNKLVNKDNIRHKVYIINGIKYKLVKQGNKYTKQRIG